MYGWVEYVRHSVLRCERRCDVCKRESIIGGSDSMDNRDMHWYSTYTHTHTHLYKVELVGRLFERLYVSTNNTCIYVGLL